MVDLDANDFSPEPFSQLTEWDGHASSVDGRLALRASLPAAMQPKPLVGILPNVVLDHPGEQGGIGNGIRLHISTGANAKWGSKSQYVLVACLFPEQKAGQDTSAGFHGNPRHAVSSTSGLTKKL